MKMFGIMKKRTEADIVPNLDLWPCCDCWGAANVQKISRSGRNLHLWNLFLYYDIHVKTLYGINLLCLCPWLLMRFPSA